MKFGQPHKPAVHYKGREPALIERVHGLIDAAVEDHEERLAGLVQGPGQELLSPPGRRAKARNPRRRVPPGGGRSRCGSGERRSPRSPGRSDCMPLWVPAVALCPDPDVARGGCPGRRRRRRCCRARSAVPDELADGKPAEVHDRSGAGPGAPGPRPCSDLGRPGPVPLPPELDAPLAGQLLDEQEARVVTGLGVFLAGVAQADDGPHPLFLLPLALLFLFSLLFFLPLVLALALGLGLLGGPLLLDDLGLLALFGQRPPRASRRGRLLLPCAAG